MPYILKKKSTCPEITVGMHDRCISEPGIPLDVKGDKVSISPRDQHCMIIGSSGRGKTRRAVFPSVVLSARAGHSIICLDPKGECYRNTAEEVRRCGHEIRILNLRNPICGNRWSPLTLVQRYWNAGNRSHAIMLLKDIAEMITADIASTRDGFWHMAAADAFMGFSLLLLEHGQKLTFDQVHYLVNDYFRSTPDQRETFRNSLDTTADSYRRITTLTNLDADTTLSCVVSEFNSSIGRFADQKDVRDLLLGSDYDLTNIGRSPIAYYVIVPDESTVLHPIAGLFIAQSYSELIHYADSREENTLPICVDYYIDEFGSIPGSDWPSKLTAARSRGIRFTLAIQTSDQLTARFGEHAGRVILSNCRTVEYLGGRDMRFMRLLEDLSGHTTDKNGFEHPKLSVEDMAGMEMGQTIILDDSGIPRYGFLPDWEVWGIRTKANLSETAREYEPVGTLDLQWFCPEPFSGTDSRETGVDVGDLSEEEKLEVLENLYPASEEAKRNIDEIEKLFSKLADPPEPTEGFDNDDELPF